MSNNAKQPTPYLHCWCMHLWMGLGWRCYHPTTQTAAHTRAQYWCVCVHFSCIVHIEPVMFKADWPLMTTEDFVLPCCLHRMAIQRLQGLACSSAALWSSPWTHPTAAARGSTHSVYGVGNVHTGSYVRTYRNILHDHPTTHDRLRHQLHVVSVHACHIQCVLSQTSHVLNGDMCPHHRQLRAESSCI